MTASITTRPTVTADETFLYTVYADTRQEELSVVDWDAAQKETFLRMQFNAQHSYYHEQFPDADYEVILQDEQPIGRLYVHRRDEEIRIVDIALLRDHCGRGIGSKLLMEILDEAQQADKPVRIHVEKFNPAMRLYERLGFVQTDDVGVYFLMEWSPEMSRKESAS